MGQKSGFWPVLAVFGQKIIFLKQNFGIFRRYLLLQRQKLTRGYLNNYTITYTIYCSTYILCTLVLDQTINPNILILMLLLLQYWYTCEFHTDEFSDYKKTVQKNRIRATLSMGKSNVVEKAMWWTARKSRVHLAHGFFFIRGYNNSYVCKTQL